VPDRRSDIREGYDEIAAQYHEERSEAPAELSLLESFAGSVPDDGRVLDAGCGGGAPVTAFLSDRVEVTGLDFSRAQLELADERLPGTPLVQGDMTGLPFADGAFGGLCSIYAVIHVPWKHHRACFAEFHRVLEPGAPVLLTVGTTDWCGHNDDWMGFGAEMHWEIPGLERTADLLEAAGFDVGTHEAIADNVSEEDGQKAFVRATA
jgi:SAM-dependent methyltransferase